MFQVTWDAARTACTQEMGSDGQYADLASIHSQAEADLLAARAASMYAPWLGLVRAMDGSFSWSDGSALDFENWESGEPNSVSGDGEDCVQMYNWDGKWNDAHCTNTYLDYICMTSKRESCQIFLHVHIICFLVAQTTSEPPTTEPQTEPNTTPATEPTTTAWQPDTPSTTAWNPDNPTTTTTTTQKTTPTQADNGGETPSKRKFEDHIITSS